MLMRSMKSPCRSPSLTVQCLLDLVASLNLQASTDCRLADLNRVAACEFWHWTGRLMVLNTRADQGRCFRGINFRNSGRHESIATIFARVMHKSA
jgi:hypothetical protein